MSGFDFAAGPSYELIIAGELEATDTKRMIRAVQSSYLTHKVLIFRPTDEESPEILELAEYTKYHGLLWGRAAAYVCIDFSCRTPTSDVEQMMNWLNEKNIYKP
jgi:uncharacterized protein YyaL (SSP411 family)